MLKFDVRSSRVKGLSFHPQRSWILCGLHNGSIQIWDYDRNTSVDTFAGHEGSVRCVDFHSVQPLFVSGGDDFMVKVWNYKLRRCLYTLSGHTDYVRTTFFHLTKPWIVSASDDYTIRVWNWQSRCSIATLPGHNHYVMCAQFHQKLDLLVSASLDSTVRVWDLSNLGMASQESDLAQDLLGSSDVTVKYQLERHSRGVNWAEFHPTEPIVFSCADDCTVRQWYLNDCSNPRTFYCHKKNVSCVKFFGDRFIISNGEDNTIMVSTVNASGSMRSTPLFERDYDRYWTLAIHPSRHLIAAGHDSGLIVFKLFRERQPFTFRDDKTIFYVEKGMIVEADLETLKVVERNLELDSQQVTPDAISYDPGTSQVAIAFHKDERVRIVNPFGRSQGYSSPVSPTQAQRFFFIGPHKAAMLVGGKLKIKTFHPKETIQEVDIECTSLHPGPPGCVVCQRGDTALLYHIAQRGTLAEAVIPGLKYVYWDRHGSKVAFVSKNSITIMTKSFKHIATVAESSWRVKSVVFDEQRDILYFTTSNHLSYCNLRTGEYSTISSLRNVVYLVKAVGDRIWALHREGGLSSSTLDNFELNLKLKLHQNAYREVIQIIQRNDLKGQALVGYLRKHGHAEIALHFVSDPLTRFNLALECGSIEIAKASAQTLNKASIWRRLAEVAIQYGDIQLSQFASNNAGNYHYSGFLCALTENTATLGHLIDATDDESFKVQHGLLLGDVQQRVQILARAGQLPLAYLTAASNGLDDLAEELLAHMEPEVAENVRQMKYAPASPLIVGTPCTDNWPLLKTEDTFFARLLKEPGTLDAIVEPALEDDHVGAGWNDDEDDADGMLPADEDDLQDEDGEEAGGWDEDDLDLDVNAAVEAVESAEAGAEFVIPRTNAPISQQWTAVSSSPAVHVAAGSFATALNLLRRQIALADPLPLKPYMIALWASVNASRPGMYAPSSTCFVTRQDVDGRGSPRTMPMLPNYVPTLTDVLRTAFQLFVEGRFADALKSFEDILLKAVLTSVQSDEDKRTLRELISTAQEYARALSVQLALRNEEPSSNRALELSLYFTHFKLHRTHLTLALSQAMTKAYKKKNFKMAAGVARRLLEQEPAPTKAKQATAIIAEADKNPTDDSPLDFDERNPFTICSVSHTIMYRGNVESIFCSYCRAPAHPSHKGAVCPVCHIATLGAEYSGLVNEA